MAVAGEKGTAVSFEEKRHNKQTQAENKARGRQRQQQLQGSNGGSLQQNRGGDASSGRAARPNLNDVDVPFNLFKLRRTSLAAKRGKQTS